MKYLVTGATGKLGTMVVNHLLKHIPASELAVSVREPDKANQLKELGVDVRKGDFQDITSMEKAFSGIDKVLMISIDGDNETRIRLHRNAVQAAKNAGVKYIVYTSAADAEHSILSLAEVHRTTEDEIRKSGINYSFLRNNWYVENELGSIQAAVAGAPFVISADAGKVCWALKREYAEVAANVLIGEGHENTIYELSNKPISYQELADALGRVLKKDVVLQNVDDATYVEIMRTANVPDYLLPMLVEIQKSIREGALDVQSDDFENLLGHPLSSLEEALAELIHE
jgi:NAD(P)H dehydrogenase (quinone)